MIKEIQVTLYNSNNGGIKTYKGRQYIHVEVLERYDRFVIKRAKGCTEKDLARLMEKFKHKELILDASLLSI